MKKILLKILKGAGNPANRDVVREVDPKIADFFIRRKYGKKADPKDVSKADKGKTLTKDNARRLIGNMAKAKGDKDTLDFLKIPNPAKKPNGKKTPSSFEREFNLDKKNALKQIENQLTELRKVYSKYSAPIRGKAPASPGILKNIIREANKLKNKQKSIQKATFGARVKADTQIPLFDISEDIKRTRSFLENIPKESKNFEYAKSTLGSLDIGKSPPRRFGGKSPRGEVPTRSGVTLSNEGEVRKVEVTDEAAAVKEGTKQLRGEGKLTPTEQKELQEQIKEYIGKGGTITKGKPSKGTAPDDTPGLKDPLAEAQTLLGVDAPPGFSPTNVERKAKDKLIEEEGILRQLQKKKASKSEITKAQNKVIRAMQKLQEVRTKEIIKKIEDENYLDVYKLPPSQIENIGLKMPQNIKSSNKKGEGPDSDENIKERKKGGRLRKRKPKRVVRGVGAAKRGYGKANYSHKMY